MIVEHNLDVVTKKYDLHHTNYTHCSRVLHSMNKLLHKISESNLLAKNSSAGRPGATVMNNPIMSATSESGAPRSKKSEPSAVMSSYTDTLLSHYAAGAHIDQQEVLRSSLERASIDSVDASLDTATAAAVKSTAEEQVFQRGAAVVQNSSEQDEEFIKQHLGELYAHIEPYNHAHCSDCTCVYSMANECLMHLAASQHQSQECSMRLNKLVQDFKERVKEDADRLEALDWGGHNHVHLA